MMRVYLAGPACALAELERANRLLQAHGYDARPSWAIYGLPAEPVSVSDCVDSAAADLDALLAASVVAVCVTSGPEPWECEVARAIGIPVVPLRSLIEMRAAG